MRRLFLTAAIILIAILVSACQMTFEPRCRGSNMPDTLCDTCLVRCSTLDSLATKK